MTSHSITSRNVVLLAQQNMLEAMRVASGLTIYGHLVSLIFMHRALTENEINSEQAELLELAEIVPLTTVPAMQSDLRLIMPDELGQILVNADSVISV